MALVDKSLSSRNVLLDRPTKPYAMQPGSLSGRQQQLGLLMGRTQPGLEALEAARVAALLNGQSNSFNLQSSLGTGLGGGLGAAPTGLNLNLGSLPQGPQSVPPSAQLGLPDQLALLSQFPHALFPQQYGSTDRDLQLSGLRNVGKTRSSDSRSSSAYASRHQAAEQRRRTRINERLELLRKLVPHAERANTACFLEEVIKYIEALKRRTLELEVMLEAATGKPVAKSIGMSGSLGPALEQGPDSQAPSPRHPAIGSGQGTTPTTLGPGAPQGANGGASASPQLAPSLSQQQQPASEPPSLRSLDSSTLQQLQLSQAAASQLAQLLPPAQQQQQQPQGQQQGQTVPQPSQSSALFQHGGGLSLGVGGGVGAGSLSLGASALNSVSLAHLTAGLQAQHGLSQGHAAAHLAAHTHHSHHHSHHAHQMAQQLSDLQSMHMMQSLQQGRSSHPPTFHPSNNKAFLHFNEDFFGGIKPELLPSRSLAGAAASTTPSTSLQLTTAQLPTDSNTLIQIETARKTQSGSPVSSEESGVPLKKRKVLLL